MYGRKTFYVLIDLAHELAVRRMISLKIKLHMEYWQMQVIAPVLYDVNSLSDSKPGGANSVTYTNKKS